MPRAPLLPHILGIQVATLLIFANPGTAAENMPSPSFAGLFPDSGFVKIPAGEFMMGAAGPGDDTRAPGRSRWNDNQPQHRVHLKAFEMGRYEVTQRQFAALMGKISAFFRGLEGKKEEHGTGMVYATAVMSQFEDSLDQPIEQVSWKGAQAFIAKCNELDPTHTYRLPTEAEWEYACRAGATDDTAADLYEVAWYYSPDQMFNKPQPHPVGRKKANAWGLYDMLGNVWEWCEDPWHSTYVGAHEDGSVWFNARSTDGNYPDRRVMRGGSWLDRADHCQPTTRWFRITDFGINWVGFRLVRTTKEVKP